MCQEARLCKSSILPSCCTRSRTHDIRCELQVSCSGPLASRRYAVRPWLPKHASDVPIARRRTSTNLLRSFVRVKPPVLALAIQRYTTLPLACTRDVCAKNKKYVSRRSFPYVAHFRVQVKPVASLRLLTQSRWPFIMLHTFASK